MTIGVPLCLEDTTGTGSWCCVQGRTDHLETRALPEAPEVSRGPHEMPLVPFS
ncbi:unnamed protein product [Staurois parvus]|uniref:Uncharacterized protein n=1 Tax=Staurois parvus TaxID=386267 RepID=A0ABN9FEY5_9NEOB|nr:unnamed protein product [Staurois parvus]